MVGGAWPFLVGGAICLVNSDNERDFGLLNSTPVLCARAGSGARCLSGVMVLFAGGCGAGVYFLEGQAACQSHEIEQ